MARTLLALTLTMICCSVMSAQQPNPQCPTISVIGPAGGINPGDIMNFSARTKGLVPSRSLFQWTVSNGAIESGQGTRSINVRVPPNENGGNVTATVTLTGLPNACLVTASEIAPINAIPIGEPVDKYGQLSLFDEYARVHLGIVAAKDNRAYLLVMIREAPRFGSAQRMRLSKIKAFISQRLHFPLRNLRIITRIGPQVQNVIWLVPPGAKMPE